MDEECSLCGAPPFLQDATHVVPEDGERSEPDHCPMCGALIDNEGKVFGP